MSTTNETGLSIYFVADGLTVHQGEGFRSEARVMRRGDRLLVTPALRAANLGRGQTRTVFELSRDEQVERFGRVMFEVGEPPEDFDALVPGSFEHDQARANALKEAAEIADPDAQRVALARVREKFGVPASGRSKTLRTLTDHR